MREIKYRGINNETGAFVYGWYTKLQSGARRYDAIISYVEDELTEFYIHDKETIGQFTGLTDKNGVDIYEGDIISYDSYGNYIITWDGDSGCWDTDFIGSVYEPFVVTNLFELSESPEQSQAEVIGNIHQNPELLKSVN